MIIKNVKFDCYLFSFNVLGGFKCCILRNTTLLHDYTCAPLQIDLHGKYTNPHEALLEMKCFHDIESLGLV